MWNRTKQHGKKGFKKRDTQLPRALHRTGIVIQGNSVEFFRKQVPFASVHEGVMFRRLQGLKGGPWKNHCLNKAFFRSCIYLSNRTSGAAEMLQSFNLKALKI